MKRNALSCAYFWKISRITKYQTPRKNQNGKSVIITNVISTDRGGAHVLICMRTVDLKMCVITMIAVIVITDF